MPRHLDPYRLVRRLGAGGMAEVFLALAFGASGFEKRVVLKVLRPEHVGNSTYERMFLEEGEVSDPVRTTFGWHVVKVEERRAGEVPPFEKVRGEMEAKLRQEKVQKYAEQYVSELRQKASVEVKI